MPTGLVSWGSQSSCGGSFPRSWSRNFQFHETGPDSDDDVAPPPALNAVRGAPKIAVGRIQSFMAREHRQKSFRDRGENSTYVRIEVVRELSLGDHVDGTCFKQLGGILVRVTEKPEFAPTVGKPQPSTRRAVTLDAWRQQAAFFAFLRFAAVLEPGRAISQDFLEQSGVVRIMDDGLCGWHCLAYLLRCGVRETLVMARNCLQRDDLQERRLWDIADVLMLNLDSLSSDGTVSRCVLELKRRGTEGGYTGGEYMLPDGDLVRLCMRLGLNVPVVSVDDDFDCMRGTNNFSSLAEVAKGSSAWSDDLQKLSLDEAGRALDKKGFLLVTIQALGQNRSRQDLAEAQRLIIGLKEHYFVLDRPLSGPAKTQASRPASRQGVHCWNCLSRLLPCLL
mmetsp:Transcript_65577/g.203156  ORF Transcript_65577/g.203156 Transcript_65577/m.203156 type:complete len:393 (+) Transcript_65577:34-1212(+)